jgi:hypothetical protein
MPPTKRAGRPHVPRCRGWRSVIVQKCGRAEHACLADQLTGIGGAGRTGDDPDRHAGDDELFN